MGVAAVAPCRAGPAGPLVYREYPQKVQEVLRYLNCVKILMCGISLLLDVTQLS